MKNLIGVCVPDAAEQVRIGERALERVIVPAQGFNKRREINVQHLEPARVVPLERLTSLDDVKGCLTLRPRFGHDERSSVEVESHQANFAWHGRSRRSPAKTARDHEMEHEEQLALQFEDDTLAQPVQVGDDTPFDRSKWRVDRAQQKSRDKPDAPRRAGRPRAAEARGGTKGCRAIRAWALGS